MVLVYARRDALKAAVRTGGRQPSPTRQGRDASVEPASTTPSSLPPPASTTTLASAAPRPPAALVAPVVGAFDTASRAPPASAAPSTSATAAVESLSNFTLRRQSRRAPVARSSAAAGVTGVPALVIPSTGVASQLSDGSDVSPSSASVQRSRARSRSRPRPSLVRARGVQRPWWSLLPSLVSYWFAWDTQYPPVGSHGAPNTLLLV